MDQNLLVALEDIWGMETRLLTARQALAKFPDFSDRRDAFEGLLFLQNLSDNSTIQKWEPGKVVAAFELIAAEGISDGDELAELRMISGRLDDLHQAAETKTSQVPARLCITASLGLVGFLAILRGLPLTMPKPVKPFEMPEHLAAGVAWTAAGALLMGLSWIMANGAQTKRDAIRAEITDMVSSLEDTLNGFRRAHPDAAEWMTENAKTYEACQLQQSHCTQLSGTIQEMKTRFKRQNPGAATDRTANIPRLDA